MNMLLDLGFSDAKSMNFWRKIGAELIGCILLLVCVVCGTSWTDKPPYVVQISLGVGSSFATLSYAFAHVSGGHLNPIVSMAMVTCGRMSLFQGVMYMLAQLLGAIIGSAITFTCMPNTVTDKNNLISSKYASATLLYPGVKPPQGFGLELLFTSLLVFFVLSVTDPIKKIHPCNRAGGTGLAVTACHLCLVPYTGCGLNPARSLGPAVITGGWTHHWIYWLGPMSGGVVASVFYNFVFFVSEKDVSTGVEELEVLGRRRRRSRRCR